jgi:hypothetical protein
MPTLKYNNLLTKSINSDRDFLASALDDVTVFSQNAYARETVRTVLHIADCLSAAGVSMENVEGTSVSIHLDIDVAPPPPTPQAPPVDESPDLVDDGTFPGSGAPGKPPIGPVPVPAEIDQWLENHANSDDPNEGNDETYFQGEWPTDGL